jgi:DNA repair protein RecN (Recombination protein N)
MEQFLQDCHEQCDKNKKVFFDWANCLHEERLEKSKTLSQKVQHELTALKLPEAFFTFLVDRGDESSWNERGISEINMMVRTNPKHQLSKLEQIASGGEMSRMLLAIKASLNNFTPHVCLIFDEIDHGVGGDVAMRIGSRLFRLSDQDQVLCITHSPQVAAWADQHLLVEKINAQTMVKTLNESERLEEIARMLSGSITTDDARQAARSLVHDVQKAKNI